jgi:hypothetical protein
MAKYLLLIYGDEQIWDAMSVQEQEMHDAAHGAFAARAGTRVLGGHQLTSSGTAVTLRGTTLGRPTSTDGPFLETKEALGGYYLIEAADLAEATALAELLPEVRQSHSGVEIRAIVEHG